MEKKIRMVERMKMEKEIRMVERMKQKTIKKISEERAFKEILSSIEQTAEKGKFSIMFPYNTTNHPLANRVTEYEFVLAEMGFWTDFTWISNEHAKLKVSWHEVNKEGI